MTDPAQAPERASLWRRLPFVVLLIAAGLAFYFYHDLLSFDALAQNRAQLLDLRDQHYLLASLAFILTYAAVVALSLPGAIILTLAGGFLFGVFPGFLYNAIGATFGAVVVFMAARAGFGRDIAARIEAQGGAASRFQAALKDNEWSVLLAVRLFPLFPFFVANLVPAFVGVRLSTFAITTFLGILPADVIYAALGSGLGEVFARGEVPSLGLILRPEFGLPLIGLTVLAIVPVAVKLYRNARG